MFYLGLYKENHHFRAAALCVKKNTVFLEDFYDIALLDDDVKPFYKIAEKYANDQCFIAGLISAKKVLIREKELSIPSKRQIGKALPFILEEMIPYNPQETLYSTKFIEKASSPIKLSVVATKRSCLEEKIQELAAMNLECDFIGNEYSALIQTANFLHPSAALKAIFYVSKEKALFVFSSDKEILFTYSAYFDSHDLGVDDETFFEEKLNRHLLRITTYFQEKNSDLFSQATLCVFCKSGFIQKRISEVLDLGLSTKKEEESTLSPFAMPIGAALQCYKNEGSFLSSDYASQRQLKRAKKRFINGAIPLVSTALLLILSNGVYSLIKQHELSKRLSIVNEAPFERLSFNKLEERLTETEKKFKKEKETLSFLFTYPTASDALAWISSHPLLCKVDEKSGQRVEIEQLNYKIEENEGKVSGVILEVKALFPTVEMIKAFQKSLEKDPFIDKRTAPYFNEEGLYLNFKLSLQNQLKGKK